MFGVSGLRKGGGRQVGGRRTDKQEMGGEGRSKRRDKRTEGREEGKARNQQEDLEACGANKLNRTEGRAESTVRCKNTLKMNSNQGEISPPTEAWRAHERKSHMRHCCSGGVSSGSPQGQCVSVTCCPFFRGLSMLRWVGIFRFDPSSASSCGRCKSKRDRNNSIK